MNFIAENQKYKVYSLDESVYLKEKNTFENQNDYSKNDKFIAYHYGNPNNGIITDYYVIISGYGISVYDLKNGTEKHFFDGENNWWTNGVHQDEKDDYKSEFRFVSWNSEDKLRVFKMNILTEKLTELE